MHYSIINVCLHIILFGIVIISGAVNYPSDLPKCHMGDNKCITEVVQLFASSFSTNGIPSIDLPALDPLFVGRIDMLRNRNKNNLNLNVNETVEHINWRNSNVYIIGLKNATFTITGFEKNLSDSNIIITIFIPKLTLTADYNLNFTLSPSPAKFADGHLNFDFEKVHIRFNFKIKIYEKDDGKQYMKIDQPKYDYTLPTASDLNFGINFDDNELLKLLSDLLSNTHGRLLIDVLKSESCSEYARSFTEIIEPIFNKFSIDQIFLIDDE